jgi:hypothetical protein
VHIHFTYRDDDVSGALSIRRELAQLAPDVRQTSEAIHAGERPQAIPRGATVLMLVGTRWMRPVRDAVPYFADASDPLRRVLEAAIEDGIRIVPVLFQVPSTSWGPMCSELPASLSPLARFNVFEIRPHSFSPDLQRLLSSLRSPDRNVPWTEAGTRTLIRIEGAGGGALKWWSNRQAVLFVLVDDAEVGALDAWDGRLEAAVEPGRHAVQIRGGPLFKSEAVMVDVARGATVTLVCGRNVFTGMVSLERKG